MLNIIYSLIFLVKFDLLFNLILILIFAFSKNYLEEDLIIGLFSSIILFFLFFTLKELRAEEVRQLRLGIKKVYRIQKKVLALYYFLGSIIFKNFFKYTKKITSKIFLIKLNKIFLSISLKLKNFISKSIYLKIFNFNFIAYFVLVSLQNNTFFNTKQN